MAFIIAEIGQAHEGSLGMAHHYIDALAACGVSAVKFQTHIAEAESSVFEPFRIQFSLQDATRFDYWKRMEFKPEEWAGLKKHCEEAGVEFISSPFSLAAVELLEKIGVRRYKIGSGETTNWLMLNRIAKTGKEIILSSGMSSWTEMDASVAFLKERSVPFSVLQCTTAYPTRPEQWGLGLIAQIRERYQVRAGYSDHSGTPVACLAAAALGAEILEFHAVFDRRMFGPDAPASLTIEEIKLVTEGVKMIQTAGSNLTLKTDNGAFTGLKKIFGKSLALNKDLPEGHIVQEEDLESKKPADQGIPVQQYQEVLGKKLLTSKSRWDFLRWDDLEK